MTAVSRHLARNAGKLSASLLPAMMRRLWLGGAAQSVGRRSCILDAMGDNTFRYSPGAPGVQIAGRGDRKKRVAAALGSLGAADRDAGNAGLLAGRQGDSDSAAAEGGETGQPQHGTKDHAAATAAVVQAEPSATYWRRRFITLAVGLAVLGAASWGLSQALRVHPAGKSPAGALRSSGNGSAPRAGNPAAGGGQHGGTAGSQGGKGSGGSPGRSGPGTVTRPGTAPKPAATTSGFAGFKPAFCSWHAIVLSLSASQVQFGSGQQPAFSLSVVSTQPTDCSFNVGPGHLAVVVKEGPARIWSSSDCVSGTGSLVTALRRGVPTVVAVDWNRRTSSPGCSGPARAVPAGSYTAYAVEGSIVSPPVTLRLS